MAYSVWVSIPKLLSSWTVQDVLMCDATTKKPRSPHNSEVNATLDFFLLLKLSAPLEQPVVTSWMDPHTNPSPNDVNNVCCFLGYPMHVLRPELHGSLSLSKTSSRSTGARDGRYSQ
eukprot:138001-Amphidinium_carterae.1